jgi:hypothetical protein
MFVMSCSTYTIVDFDGAARHLGNDRAQDRISLATAVQRGPRRIVVGLDGNYEQAERRIGKRGETLSSTFEKNRVTRPKPVLRRAVALASALTSRHIRLARAPSSGCS